MSDWQEASLADLADYINGRAIKPEECSTQHGIPVIRIKQINDPQSIEDRFCGDDLDEKNIARSGDLLFSWSATLKTILWQGPTGAINQHIFKVLPKEGIDKTFLHYLIDHSLPALTEESHGSTMKHIKKSALSAFRLQIPPLPEQKKIAEILSGIDRLVEAKKRRVKQRKSLLKSAFEDATKKEATDNFVPLSDLGHWRGGGTPSKSMPEYWGGVIPWVSPKDMKGRKISCSQDAITQEALENSTASLMPKDSILFVVRSGILRHTFPIALATREVAINQDLKALTVGDHCNPNFLLHYLCCRSEEMLASCMKSGTTVESIDTNSLQNYQVPMISIQEQLRLSLFAESITTAIEAEESQVESLKMLKSSLASDLLSGRKRVSV